MKDFVTRTTFGFLMAQLFPGTLTVYSISFTYFAFERDFPNSLLIAADRTLTIWGNSPVPHQLFLLGLCIGTGMFLYGLNWAVMGHLEERYGSIFDSYWHDWRLWLQVLVAPIKLPAETIQLFVETKHIRNASIEENLPRIPADRSPHFEFLQDFYLYNAQFFSHTAYGILSCLLALVGFSMANGLTIRRAALIVLLYIAVGLFFILGRIQFRSLFAAEQELGTGTQAGSSTR
jgi:hypothetical protein